MNPFVNPAKRSVSLPAGCKDLIDVLRRQEIGEPIVKPERFESDGLTHIDHYVTKLVATSANLEASLYVRSLDGLSGIAIHRSPSEFTVYPLMCLMEREKAVEEFFRRRSMLPAVDYLVGHPGMPMRVLGFPLPSAVPDVVCIAAELMREVYGFRDYSGIEFTFVLERGGP